MQDRVKELMELSVCDLQKRAVASIIALIESDDVYDDVKKEAIEALSKTQEELNKAIAYYNDTYDEIYDEVIEDIAEELGYCDVCDDCNTDECVCAYCECEDDCEECECKEEECEGDTCQCYNVACSHYNKCAEKKDSCVNVSDEQEDKYIDEKPECCNCKDSCVTCEHSEKPCIGIDCGKCKNPRQDDAE